MKWIKNIVRDVRRNILHVIAGLFPVPYLGEGTVLIIAPHPDDEVLGCGGVLLQTKRKNTTAYVLFLTDGEGAHRGCCLTEEEQVGNRRRELSRAVADILKLRVDNLFYLKGKDGGLPCEYQDGFNSMAKKIAGCICEIQPDIVFFPHPLEGWSDHVAASELTHSAICMLPEESRPRLYYYCVWFWYSMPLRQALKINWRKARLLDISRQVMIKKMAISAYLDGLAPCGNPWVGRLPKAFLRAFDWNKELYFEADITPNKESKGKDGTALEI